MWHYAKAGLNGPPTRNGTLCRRRPPKGAARSPQQQRAAGRRVELLSPRGAPGSLAHPLLSVSVLK
ncbi:hypothetical protein C5470_21370, partial [Photorhabdus stackebrandtii]|nr:hypothetical protein [Photorhabdus stackebrandtii]